MTRNELFTRSFGIQTFFNDLQLTNNCSLLKTDLCVTCINLHSELIVLEFIIIGSGSVYGT
jgi:hypothetical protein